MLNPPMIREVAPPGFEPGSSGPKPDILDRYTTGLYCKENGKSRTYKGFGYQCTDLCGYQFAIFKCMI